MGTCGGVAFHFTYLNYAFHIQSMIYTTNWIERLQKDFRRVTRMRGAMPDELSVIVLMGKTAMDKDSYRRVIPRMRVEGFSDPHPRYLSPPHTWDYLFTAGFAKDTLPCLSLSPHYSTCLVPHILHELSQWPFLDIVFFYVIAEPKAHKISLIILVHC